MTCPLSEEMRWAYGVLVYGARMRMEALRETAIALEEEFPAMAEQKRRDADEIDVALREPNALSRFAVRSSDPARSTLLHFPAQRNP